MYTFDSQIKRIKVCDNSFSQDEIKNEPMLFSCDAKHADFLGGQLTHFFLQKLWNSGLVLNWDNLIVDSRVHMLMPGWWPCIPGFHHDSVPRTRSDGQPDYNNQKYRSQHCLMLLGKASATEFAIGKADFPEIPLGEICYKHWHPLVVDKINSGELVKVPAPYGELVFFDDRSWHQGTAAIENGWRFFIRASWNTDRKPINELRRQVQVYLENPMEGW